MQKVLASHVKGLWWMWSAVTPPLPNQTQRAASALRSAGTAPLFSFCSAAFTTQPSPQSPFCSRPVLSPCWFFFFPRFRPSMIICLLHRVSVSHWCVTGLSSITQVIINNVNGCVFEKLKTSNSLKEIMKELKTNLKTISQCQAVHNGFKQQVLLFFFVFVFSLAVKPSRRKWEESKQQLGSPVILCAPLAFTQTEQ